MTTLFTIEDFEGVYVLTAQDRDKTNYIFEYEEAELIGEFIGYYNRNPIAAGFAYEQRELSKSVLDLLMNGIY